MLTVSNEDWTFQIANMTPNALFPDIDTAEDSI